MRGCLACAELLNVRWDGHALAKRCRWRSDPHELHRNARDGIHMYAVYVRRTRHWISDLCVRNR
jgi:hypothetical protein